MTQTVRRAMVVLVCIYALPSPAIAADCDALYRAAAACNSAIGHLAEAQAVVGGAGDLSLELGAARDQIQQALDQLTAAREPALIGRATQTLRAIERLLPPAIPKSKPIESATKRAQKLARKIESRAAGASCAPGVELNGSLLELSVFPASNWWHQDVSSWSVSPRSAEFIGYIGRDRGLHPDFGTTFGIPYLSVASEQARVAVGFDYADESDSGAPGLPAGYPIPEIAKHDPGYIEGGEPGGGNSGDRHMLIVDRDHRYLYELYALHWTGSTWHAGSGAIFDLDSNSRRPEGWTSADAAGLAILPGLVRADELFVRGSIDHAIRFTVHGTQGYTFPASHDATHGPGGNSRPPLGTRARLKSDFDISGFSPEVQVILKAMKRYGLILADNGSDWYFQGAPDPRWNDERMHDEFLRVTGNDFEIVESP